MKKNILLLTVVLSCVFASNDAFSQKIQFNYSNATGAITKLSLSGDIRNMNRILPTGGTQYSCTTPKYSWGLGEMTVAANGIVKQVRQSGKNESKKLYSLINK
jgi:hypothetical protein